MARKPTHYRLTVSRPVETSGIMFKPDARYTVKAAVHDTLRDMAPDAIAAAEPMILE